jgi:hypothetical protein
VALGIAWEIVENALNICIKFALVWVVLLAAVARAFERTGDRESLRVVASDLAVALAARGAVMAVGLAVWWRSTWWVQVAYPVFQIGAADVVLALAAVACVGGFRSLRAPAYLPGGGASMPGSVLPGSPMPGSPIPGSPVAGSGAFAGSSFFSSSGSA